MTSSHLGLPLPFPVELLGRQGDKTETRISSAVYRNISRDNAVQFNAPAQVGGRHTYQFVEKKNNYYYIAGDVYVCPPASEHVDTELSSNATTPYLDPPIPAAAEGIVVEVKELPTPAAQNRFVRLKDSKGEWKTVYAQVSPEVHTDWISGRIVRRLGLKTRERGWTEQIICDGSMLTSTSEVDIIFRFGETGRSACWRRFDIVEHVGFDVLLGATGRAKSAPRQ